MRRNPWTGVVEDDMERFFRRSPWEVSAADIWRWKAACAAVRELDGEK
jgi:hypothetical protein